jgi:hypothetical protein
MSAALRRTGWVPFDERPTAFEADEDEDASGCPLLCEREKFVVKGLGGPGDVTV